MLLIIRRQALFILLLLGGYSGRSQQRLSPIKMTATSYLHSRATTSCPGSIVLEAFNATPVPYTVVLNPDSLHIYPGTAFPLRMVVQPGKAQVVLARLKPSSGHRAHYRYKYQSYLGNTLAPPTSRGFVYQLPFEPGKQYRLTQGNNRFLSHTSKHAFDFSMPEGTVVCAARTGIISHSKQASDTGCPTHECAGQGNYTIVFHNDGSFAKYARLCFDGSLVEEGERVATGQPLGYSGNTGWLSGPHLHFEVGMPGEPERVSVPVTFSVEGRPLGKLVPGTLYGRYLQLYRTAY